MQVVLGMQKKEKRRRGGRLPSVTARIGIRRTLWSKRMSGATVDCFPIVFTGGLGLEKKTDHCVQAKVAPSEQSNNSHEMYT